MIQTLAVDNYRSLRRLTISMGRLNVVTGANGTGKSSLYRALKLLADAALGGLVRSLAIEGGLASTLWAGPENISRAMRTGEAPIQGGPRTEPVRLRLGFTDGAFGYSTELGLPVQAPGSSARSLFANDPVIKRECVWAGALHHPSAALVERRGPRVEVLGERDDWSCVATDLAPYHSMLAEIADPVRAPVILNLRERVRSWRFYDHFRTDAEAPARQAQIGTQTPVLAHDGRDLAAALQTIREVGDSIALDAVVTDAFPGSTLDVVEENGRFRVRMGQHGLLRPFEMSEVSDGTLRYLMWITALLSPRPPELMVLNEPETSLNPDLLPALGRSIARAASRTQIWVITHSSALVAALEKSPECRKIELEKDVGETRVVGQTLISKPDWRWPAR